MIDFEEFYTDYKNQLMKDLLTDEDIVKLIDSSVTTKNSAKLAYKNVFPYEYVPETIEYATTYVCFDVDLQKNLGKTYLSPTIHIWVFTHKSLLRLSGESGDGVRTDRLVSKIVKKLNGSYDYGLGTLDLYSVKRFAPVSDYQGKVITFHTEDFNSLSASRKKPPTNRKRGV